MPRLDGPAIDKINQRESVDAHRIRLRDRKEQFEKLLALVPQSKTKDHPTPEQERHLIQDALAEIADQQKELEQIAPALLAEAEETDRLRAQRDSLQAEVESLRLALAESANKREMAVK